MCMIPKRGGRDKKLFLNNSKSEKAYLASFNSSLISESQTLAFSQISFEESVSFVSCESDIGKDL